MKFPDRLTIRKSTVADEYGNPRKAPAPSSSSTVSGFLATRERLLLPPSAQVAKGDRVELGDARFEVTDVNPARSPSKTVLLVVTLKEVP